MSEKMTRRDFMRGTAAAAMGIALGIPLNQAKKARVVLVRHQLAVDENSQVNKEIIAKMLDDAVMALTQQTDPLAGWKKLIDPSDVVGIKTNVWRFLPTPAELEAAIKQRLQDVGVAAENIAFNDRGVRNDPVFQRATALINTRPLRTHYWAGIGGCIKNLITFGERWPDYHPDSCADLGLLLKLPQVQGKIRLNILCALTPQFHGRGPHHFDQRYVWRYNGLIVSTDAVAADAVGLKLIQAKRLEHFGQEIELETTPKHIRLAGEKHKVGVSDWNQIELIKLGWNDGILI
ncbi:MAG: DUF362 domain-containing protein [candidate division KSB1 bacterium]|nr:DUF362 domain-containing protein [candidate division KSB1 bacterium]MDZ7357517.1 DUF362 domain-containing protein [candidate division KSB1 bacterium]MDZ7375789.1 DUF362 domain-containing protein [candidate division KSB1 bacterium]MDZ7399720.1 DUF362 domain-containing protein [candidate division KSB1 bacterium]